MKQISSYFVAVIFALNIAATTVVSAETVLPGPIVINEFQTNGAGSGTTLQEFIELTNVSLNTVDVSGLRLVYVNSSGTVSTLYTFAPGSQIISNEYLVFAPLTAPVDYLSSISPIMRYIAPSSSGIAASSGKLQIIDANNTMFDDVQWNKTASAATGEIIQNSGDGSSSQRKVVNAKPQVTGSNKTDFEILAVPTPFAGIVDVQPPPPIEEDEPPIVVPPTELDPVVPPVPPSEQPDNLPEQTPPDSSVPETTTTIYLPILLNELFIDPTTPLTDANDEWVELYNPNSVPVDLGSYTVSLGVSYSYKHTFSAGNIIESNSYIVVTSAESNLALANGGGAAKVTSPDGTIFDEVSYQEAPAGESWAKNSSAVWEWTTTTTKDAQNIITSPVPAAIKAAAAKVAKPKTTKAKVTAVKAATSKAKKTAAKTKAKSTSSLNEPALIAAPTPIPSWLLAGFAVLAILYVCYEYRYEASNYIYKLKNNRSARG